MCRRGMEIVGGGVGVGGREVYRSRRGRGGSGVGGGWGWEPEGGWGGGGGGGGDKVGGAALIR